MTSLALARAARNRMPRNGAIMLVVSGLAPDLDYASYIGGPGAFLRFHRSLLHSIPGSAVMVLAIAGAFWAFEKHSSRKSLGRNSRASLPFKAALAVCAVGAGAHILLDLASGVGVQLLWPLGERWYEWDLAANLDPWILALLLAGIFLPQLFRLVNEEVGDRKKPTGASPAAMVTLLLLAAYFGARASLRSRAIELLLSREYHGRGPHSAGAFPTSTNPFSWRGLVVTDNSIEEMSVPLGPGADFDPDRSLTHFKPDDSPALDAGEKTAASKIFLAWTRFPLATVSALEDGYRFELRDLRFPPNDPSPANILCRVDFDRGLRIKHQEFRQARAPNP
jgi:inner membrane protein